MKPAVEEQFTQLTEEEIFTALNDPEDNPISLEVARMLDAYAAVCAEAIRNGDDPNDAFGTGPSCALDKVVMEMISDMISAEEEAES